MTNDSRITVHFSDTIKRNSVKENENGINQIAEANGDEKIKLAWDLVVANFTLVPYVIGRYFSGNKNKDELTSWGIDGLFCACKRVKKNTPNKSFTSYAIKYIYGYIMKKLSKGTGQIHFPKGDEPINGGLVSFDTSSCNNASLANKIPDDYDSIALVLKKSDGDFCKYFYKMARSHHYQCRKRHGIQGIPFYTEKNKKILKVDGEDHQTAPKKLGLSRQAVSQAQQSAFVYMAQYLRDATPKTQNEFFTTIFSKDYTLDNPPLFEGWRKRIWDEIMKTPKYSYHKVSDFIHHRK